MDTIKNSVSQSAGALLLAAVGGVPGPSWGEIKLDLSQGARVVTLWLGLACQMATF